MDKPTSEPILYDFLNSLVEDQWIEGRVKHLARTALAQYEEQASEQAPAEPQAAGSNAPKPQTRASGGRASGGGR